MQYRKDRYGNDLSILGYGCMRLPRKEGHVDLDASEKLIRRAFDLGINYYDTAYAYGDNEKAVGEIIRRLGIRDRINIATKMPQYRVLKPEDFEKYFTEELRRLQTDHVDYYLMHMMNDVKSLERLCGLGLQDWVDQKKKNGQIRQIGFSFHGSTDAFKKLLDGFDWEFCMVQYNYLDEHLQAGREGVRYAASKGIPVIIMEPLRGGRLVKLPADAEKLMKEYPVKKSPAQWGLSWLWAQEEIKCVLSGMNTMEMLEENAGLAESFCMEEIGEAENRLLSDVAAVIRRKMKVPCTGCRYCVPCPHGVDIPRVFASYNNIAVDGWFTALMEYSRCCIFRHDRSGAGACTGCGLCETKCPQHIEIRRELKKAGRALENPVLKAVYKAAGAFLKY